MTWILLAANVAVLTAIVVACRRAAAEDSSVSTAQYVGIHDRRTAPAA